MNRSELIQAIAGKTDVANKDVDAVLSSLADVAGEAMNSGDAIKLPGFLTFERVTRSARTARNPQTGEEIAVPAKFGVKVSAGAVLKRSVEGQKP
ncbi:DNA-binding protein HU-beta [Antricoccus suffuscus]|uniref:DNA-binding protein HU-beta n=1 Tax=Antricoccus suffuscus TaxID=1629062 RepID=A0A2T1A016_9ACTN|nr:HU family DNA-binding protein [Antricoccus suffuscus]PRZ41945.1 DNA-binding protein HU-beta [Antricoccus suffuscus]